MFISLGRLWKCKQLLSWQLNSCYVSQYQTASLWCGLSLHTPQFLMTYPPESQYLPKDGMWTYKNLWKEVRNAIHDNAVWNSELQRQHTCISHTRLNLQENRAVHTNVYLSTKSLPLRTHSYKSSTASLTVQQQASPKRQRISGNVFYIFMLV